MKGPRDPRGGQEEKTGETEETEVTGEITATTESNVVVSAGEEETGIETATTEE